MASLAEAAAAPLGHTQHRASCTAPVAVLQHPSHTPRHPWLWNAVRNKACGHTRNRRAQSDLSLHDQQQFMQHDWLPLQQQQPKPVQQQSKPLQQQQPSFQSVSLPTQQQLLHGGASRSLPAQSQSHLGGGELDHGLSSDMVRLGMQDCDVRSRRGNRSVTAEQVELGGFEFPSRGRVGGSSSWIARRALVLDSVWAAKDSE
ncbi:MAG: hypothetical protein WDW38_010949 [Sanguina aurantia]